MLINGFLEERQEGLRIDRRGDDPGVERCRSTLAVDLAEVEQEFEGVVSDREIVGVSPIGLAAILDVLALTAHHNLPFQRFPPPSKSGARFQIASSASTVPSHTGEGLVVPSTGLLKRSCQKSFVTLQLSRIECKPAKLHFTA
jgi:hypothetical protein